MMFDALTIGLLEMRIERIEAENERLKKGIADLSDYVSTDLNADPIIRKKLAALLEGKQE